MPRYTGSGVIPIIIKDNKLHLILFLLNKGTLTDAGGRIEKQKSIIDTASRELFEESAGLFNINSRTIDKNSLYVDISGYSTDRYRTYIILFDNLDNSYIDYYKNNLIKIKMENHNPFSETCGIYLIPFDNINFIDNNTFANTLTNETIIISDRTAKIIKKIYDICENSNNFYDVLIKNIKPIHIKKHKTDIITYTYREHKNITITDLDTFIC